MVALGVTIGGESEDYCGLQYKEGARSFSGGAYPTAQAECFNSSFNLLSIAPRKLRSGYKKGVKPGMLSPCPDGRSPPEAPSGCSVKPRKLRPISAPSQNYHGQSSTPLTYYADAGHLSPRQYGLYEMANVHRLQAAASSQRAARNLLRHEFPDSRSAARAVTEALQDAHQETLQKTRNPSTATRLDNMKTSILCHGTFYPRLVEASIRRRWVGASPETKKRLRELQAQVRDWRPPSMNDFNANEAVVINQTQPAHMTFSQCCKMYTLGT